MGIGDHRPGDSNAVGQREYSFRADLEIEWALRSFAEARATSATSGMFIEAVDPLWVGAGFTRG